MKRKPVVKSFFSLTFRHLPLVVSNAVSQVTADTGMQSLVLSSAVLTAVSHAVTLGAVGEGRLVCAVTHVSKTGYKLPVYTCTVTCDTRGRSGRGSGYPPRAAPVSGPETSPEPGLPGAGPRDHCGTDGSCCFL